MQLSHTIQNTGRLRTELKLNLVLSYLPSANKCLPVPRAAAHCPRMQPCDIRPAQAVTPGALLTLLTDRKKT